MTLIEFTSGTKAKSSEVNANFQELKTSIDNLTSDYSTIIKNDGSVDFTKVQKYPKMTITGATNATPIVITATAHGRSTGDKVFIDSVEGNTAVNGSWTITKITDNTFSLDGSVGNGSYTSGGTAYLLPKANEDLVNKAYADKKLIGTCSTASGTAEKAVICSDFELINEAIIKITFTNANTATTPTININSKGALSPKNMQGDALAYIPANIPLDFRYDGTNLIGLYTNTFAIMPDYAKGVSKTWNTLYTAETDGWVKFYGSYVNGTNISLEIDGVVGQFLNATVSTSTSATTIMVPVAKGSTYKGVGGSATQDLKFYPMKGAN